MRTYNGHTSIMFGMFTVSAAMASMACGAESDTASDDVAAVRSAAKKPKSSEPTFRLGSTLANTGTVVRGGPAACPPESEQAVCNCTAMPGCAEAAPNGWEPKNVFLSYEGCVYQMHTIAAVAENDFSGTVALEVLNLPSGVVSETASAITIPEGFLSRSAALKLVAAPDAPLGDTVVTVRGTSGSLVRTLDLAIAVRDALPPCPTQ